MAGQKEQFEFINGIRGLAALQVVLLHFCAIFFPAFARVAQEGNYPLESVLSHTPLFFLIDGYTAVFIFFLMSGFVLAGAFDNKVQQLPAQTLKRFIRLFLPVAVSAVFALGLFFAFQGAKEHTQAVTGSPWAAWLYHIDTAPLALLREIGLNSMLLGYGGQSIFSNWSVLSLPAISTSSNPPLWTLHIEFWGSLLVLFLAAARNLLARSVFIGIFCCALLVTGTGQFSLFLLGFVAYHSRERWLSREFNPTIGIILLFIGVLMSSLLGTWASGTLLRALASITYAQATSPEQFRDILTAIVIMLGICLSSPLRRLASARPLRWLGKISFSLYLVHFPILFTLGCSVFNVVFTRSTMLPAILTTFIVILPLLLLIASLFERYVDQPAIRLAGHLVRATDRSHSLLQRSN
ncbi:acyltransferase [Pseudomonas sp. ZM23]|uniref:Acyltransferase n=1 Tax=Pseudomonas triclosanedens TaxID=2961893 RepID=A0ABY7A1V4_9PSED|nr:acyltransferase [Pseudomonas triclosanedens]MCP8464441.1 acyltransferase [Pseudomonas triclosanedens]MCP8471575.1 acyltransferase [Pseudomonas triclosanedens]WAI51073.1 acyltransferase [Pseudomonas triclosanedens]